MSNKTIFDYDIHSDPVALSARWFITKFILWVFGPLAIFGIGFLLYCLFFYRPIRGVERAEREQQQTEIRIKKVENYFKY